MRARAAGGWAQEGDWLVAARQTSGRGRQGRPWESPTGNLYASTLIELRASDPPAPTLALVAGIALHDALAAPHALLKWPNDLVAPAKSAIGTGFAKCAGILLERIDSAVIIGFGVNLAHHPTLPERPTTSLAAIGVALSVDAAIDSLARFLTQWTQAWRQDGVGPIRQAWLARAHPIGTPLSTALPDGGRIAGTFDGLAEDCALRLRTSTSPSGALAGDAVRVIHAGDVFLI